MGEHKPTEPSWKASTTCQLCGHTWPCSGAAQEALAKFKENPEGWKRRWIIKPHFRRRADGRLIWVQGRQAPLAEQIADNEEGKEE